MGVSIKDVAKAAGVSTATVSRIINNSPLISQDTRDKTLKVMEELNYIPNSLARGLSNQKAFNVALLIDIEDAKSFSNPFFYEVMHGIETVVYKKGLCLIIASSQKSDKRVDTLEWLIYGKRMQGLIIPSSLVDNKVVDQMNKLKFPFVIIGEPSNNKDSLNWVDINNHQGGALAVEHLLKNGYRNIAYIGGNKKELFNRCRLAGYKDALLKNGIEINENYIEESNNTKQDAYNKMTKLLSMNKKPDAVICGDNILSFGAMKAITNIKLNIPNDVGIVSFDDYPIAELVEPALTSVDIDVFELGVIAAKSLLELIDNPNSKQHQELITTSINCRESTKRDE